MSSTTSIAPAANQAPLSHRPLLQGELYTVLLKRLHELLQPKTYLEIGSYSGDSLALARAKVIAIDPNFGALGQVLAGKTECHLFQMKSDRFFQLNDPRKILGGDVEMAFLDGMHLFEFLLRDFMNIEQYCAPNSIIALHDCLPIDVHITTRQNDRDYRGKHSTQPGWWTGDVWKILPILRKYRPDLHVTALDAPPTGLVLITGLDPDSRVLRKNYFDICAEFANVTLFDYGLARFFAEAALRSTRDLVTFEDISREFWL